MKLKQFFLPGNWYNNFVYLLFTGLSVGAIVGIVIGIVILIVIILASDALIQIPQIGIGEILTVSLESVSVLRALSLSYMCMCTLFCLLVQK